MTHVQHQTDEELIAGFLGLHRFKRTLCRRLFATDVDEMFLEHPADIFNEYYNYQHVGFIDYKSTMGFEVDSNTVMLWKTAVKCNVGAFIVVHLTDFTDFHIWNVVHRSDDFDINRAQVEDMDLIHMGRFNRWTFERWMHRLRGLTCCQERLP